MGKPKQKNLKILHWGPFPEEMDGGAVVNYYLWKMAHFIHPKMEQYAIPKSPIELVPKRLPFMNFLRLDQKKTVSYYMKKEKISLLEAFHIAENIEPVIDPVHELKGKIILHQTVHWEDDRLFRCPRLDEIDCVVTPTEWAKEILIIKGSISSKQIKVIPHAVDTEKFYPHATQLRKKLGWENRVVILFSGRLDLWKGVHNLIPLIRPLTEKLNASIIVRAGAFKHIAKAKELYQIFRYIEKRNPNFKFISKWMPYEFMEELFSTADIIVSPSGHEGFNMPIIEGMAVGAPVVVTDLPNHREILGDCGILIPPKQTVGYVNEDPQSGYKGTPIKVPIPNDIFMALKFLIENPEERKIMGIMGRKRAESQFSLVKIADQWIELIEKMSNE